MVSERDWLDEKTRAEDILLGSLGFDCDARIIDVELTPTGYKGHACWSDQETFEFESEETLDDLERWAIGVIRKITEEV